MASVADELQKLGALKNDGLLTDAEFDSQKKKLLAEAEPEPETGSTDNTFQKFGLILLALFFGVGLAVGKHWGSTGTADADSTTDWLMDRMSKPTADGPTARAVPPAPQVAAQPSPVPAPTPAPVVAKPVPVAAAQPAPVAQPKPAPKPAPRTAPKDSVWKVPVSDADAQIGPKDAPATVVLFSNFENSTCKSFAPNVQRLVKEYGKKVRVVFKHKVIPASADGLLASEAALAAGAQGQFWAFHDKVMAEPLVPNRAGLEGIAKGLGLKMSPFRKALDKRSYRLQALKDGLLSNAVAAHSMPNILVNGVRTSGDKSYEVMKALVDTQLASRPKDKTYDQIVAGGRTFEQLGPSVGGFDTADSPTLGKAGARVQVVVFEDFQ